ncbi:voltage-dependent N-type calcium channel subunit alpha-1B-like isoform X1 [Paramuricea clavata]|uniref:Voltage-dependent N-type calcium channel subunit alpha-1B-like isoform X1 n=1 Tax=Paramuricea clavata TaxID=317549 RepID=A0A6S7GXX3_PARCT|nr:voltage-dependent N-type calcium channel subunit alpha-1B-like isoform X1 [Paramuricea clavata]
MIAISSLSLAIEDPVEPFGQSERNKILAYFDWVFTVVFAIEVVIKIIDMGAILHKGSYFRDPWNVIDAVVVCANVATLVIRTSSSEIGSGKDILKCLRVLRVLRPLKAINKSRKLKTVFQCMVYSLKNVINIILITLLFLFIFAVIGVQLFQGKLFYCTDPSKRTEDTCKGQFFNYYRAGQHEDIASYKVTKREWKKRVFNFDSLPHAMLTLFSSLTGEGWPTTMYHTVDATEVNMGPIRDYKIHMSIYYVCFVVVFAFFFINIFVALIIVTFQESGERNILASDLDRNQRDCIQFAINAKPRQRFMPEDKSTISYKMWVLVESKPFEITIMVLIALNAVVLMMSYDGMSEAYENTLIYMNTGFTILFTIEAILKLVAFRTNYFRDGWNIFDFIIVLITFSGVILNFVRGTSDIPIDPTFFRLFRAARLIKLIRQGYTIRMLLWTFLQSLKALPYVVTLMAILFFIYAVVGMQLFGRIQLNDTTNIKHHNNFQSFPRALQVLFRAATGESWHLVMKDCFGQALCDSRAGQGHGAKCGNTAASIIYFCSFYFLCSFLMLNLFVAVILDNFEYLTRDESILGPHHLDEFVRVWSEYDPTATGRITHKNVYRLMCDMSPPVGFGRKCPRFLAYKRLIKMNMPIMGDSTVLFTSTLVALIRTALGIHNNGEPSRGDEELRQVIKRLWPKVSPKILNRMVPRDSVLSSHQLTIGKVYCAKLIYENYKNRKRKQEEMEFRGRKKRQPSLFRRLMGALRTSSSGLEDEETGNQDHLRPPPAAHLDRRRRSRTLNTPPLALRDKASNSVKISKNKSMKFFRKKRNAANRSTVSGRIVTFSEEIPMDLTDIKPTIIDCEESQRILPKPRSYTFDNPALSIDDEKFIPNLVRKSPSYPIYKGTWPPLTPALVILQVPTLERTPPPPTPPALDPSFPDVIRSAEASPRPSLTSVIQDANLIKEINERIAEAVNRGQSPYSIYAIKDGDEASWC